MSGIPKAKDFVEAQEQKERHQAASVSQAQARWLARISKASDEFVDALTKTFCDSIASATASKSYSKRVEVRLTDLGSYQGLPGDVILYGHRTSGSWYKRSPLGPFFTPFERLQAKFYSEGWYLIEESDPSRSFNFVFALYAQEPTSQKELWHNHNHFHKGRISELAAISEIPILEDVDADANEDT
jgi:hypothetical protein